MAHNFLISGNQVQPAVERHRPRTSGVFRSIEYRPAQKGQGGAVCNLNAESASDAGERFTVPCLTAQGKDGAFLYLEKAEARWSEPRQACIVDLDNKPVGTEDMELCRNACEMEREFTCKSVSFSAEKAICQLSRQEQGLLFFFLMTNFDYKSYKKKGLKTLVFFHDNGILVSTSNRHDWVSASTNYTQPCASLDGVSYAERHPVRRHDDLVSSMGGGGGGEGDCQVRFDEEEEKAGARGTASRYAIDVNVNVNVVKK